MRLQLDAQSLGEGGLPGGGRSGDHNELDAFPAGDLRCNIRDAALLQGLGGKDRLGELPIDYSFIQVPDRSYALLMCPGLSHDLGLKHLL